MQRRTRIVATLGPTTDEPGVLDQLLENGLDVARVNFSHGTAQANVARIQRLRERAQALGRHVAVLGDLPGPKLRAILSEAMPLRVGQHVTLAALPDSTADIMLTEPNAVAMIKTGQRVLLDDGRLQARVTVVTRECITLTVEVGGILLANKGINLPDTELNIAAVTERDHAVITHALQCVDWLALSFVRDASAAQELRSILTGHGIHVPILAKIERPEAVTNSAAIIDAFDGIMVARGDLGVEIALEKVPHVQKRLILEARLAGKPVITATDMLDSMRQNPRPTRAEVSDVANAVYDGTDAVMLSGETAFGEFPVEALQCMNRIVLEAETHQGENGPRHVAVPRGELIDHVTHAVCDLAHEIGAAAIITPTRTGRTSRLIARHRPKPAIVGVSIDEAVVRQLAVVWGVKGITVPFPIHRGDDRLEAAIRTAYLGGAVQPGALVVVLATHLIEGGEGFPTIRVIRVGEDGRSCEP